MKDLDSTTNVGNREEPKQKSKKKAKEAVPLENVSSSTKKTKTKKDAAETPKGTASKKRTKKETAESSEEKQKSLASKKRTKTGAVDSLEAQKPTSKKHAKKGSVDSREETQKPLAKKRAKKESPTAVAEVLSQTNPADVAESHILDSFWDSQEDLYDFQEESTASTVPLWERLTWGTLGGSLLGYGLRKRRSVLGWVCTLVGGGLLYRATRSNHSVYNAVQEKMASREANQKGLLLESGVTVRRPAKQLYKFWRDLENIPRVLGHLLTVERIEGDRIHWVVDTMPERLELDAEIVADVPNRLIAWHSPPEAPISHEGFVQFHELGDSMGTEIKVMLKYDPPAGPLVAALFGVNPNLQLEEDLVRFKAWMEQK